MLLNEEIRTSSSMTYVNTQHALDQYGIGDEFTLEEIHLQTRTFNKTIIYLALNHIFGFD